MEVQEWMRFLLISYFENDDLVHMQAAERGLRRLDVALDKAGPKPLTQVLRSLKLQSLTQVDNLQTLHQIVLALEAVAQERDVEQQSLARIQYCIPEFRTTS